MPEGAVEQANATGAIGWDPPCPAQDTGRHIYDLVLHVLRMPVDIDPAKPADVAARQVEDASQEEAPIALTDDPARPGARLDRAVERRRADLGVQGGDVEQVAELLDGGGSARGHVLARAPRRRRSRLRTWRAMVTLWTSSGPS